MKFPCALLSLAAACGTAPTKTGTDQVDDDNIELTRLKDARFDGLEWQQVDDYVEPVIQDLATKPGCAVGIARGGELTYLKGYGKAVLGGADWGVGTVAAVGSVSKSFTAAGVMLLAQQHTIDLDDDVDQHLAGASAALGGVSIASLLNHTSGAGGATQGAAFEPVWEAGSAAKTCLDTNVGCAAASQALQQPHLAFDQYGANVAVAALGVNKATYSNVGVSVAASILDVYTAGTLDDGYEGWIWHRVGGWPASDLDAQNMLSLALSHSWRANDIPRRARGYKPNGGGGYALAEAFDPAGGAANLGIEGWEGPSGGWMMTIGDLTRFTVALNTSKIVDAASLATMRTPAGRFESLQDDRAGMGIMIHDEEADGEDTPDYWHGGIIGGHTAAWSWWNNANGQSLAIAMICNRKDIGPYAILQHTEALEKAIRNTGPTLKPVIAQPQISLPGVHNRTFHLDRSAAAQTSPIGATLPITVLAHDLALRTSVSGNQLSLALVEGAVSQGQFRPATSRTPTQLGVAALTNPKFTSRPTELRLASPLGDVRVKNAVIAGTIVAGPRLTEVSIRGTLDTREVGALVGRSGSQLCGELQTTGTTCTPCADGVPTCVGFEYQRYAGALVTP